MPKTNDIPAENKDAESADYVEYKGDEKLIYKDIQFELKSSDESNVSIINGESGNFGIVQGYASTYKNTDRGGDIILPGAFTDSLKAHKRAKRAIRMKYQHYELIGGWPISKAFDDEKGLFLVGQINLDVPDGAAAYALAKQGVLSDLSIGFSIPNWDIDVELNEKTGIRKIKKADLWEVSLVSEPMNPKAKITEVKEFKDVVSFQDLPLVAIAQVLCRGGDSVDISDEDKQNIIAHVKKYYKKIGRQSPFKSGFTLLDIDFMSKRDLESILTGSGLFTNMAATYVAKYFKPSQSESGVSEKENLPGQSESDVSKVEALKKALLECKIIINQL